MKKHHWIYPLEIDPNLWGSFTYMAVCEETGHKYIGYKTFTNGWRHYKTSSPLVKKMIKEGKTFKFIVLELFQCREAAIVAESKLLLEHDVENDPLFLNRKATHDTWNRIGHETTHSAETIDKIRKAKKGKKLSKEHRAAIGRGNVGRVQSQETMDKISAKNKGKKRSKEFCDHISDALKGRKRSPESVEKQRQKQLDGSHPKFKGWYVVGEDRYPSIAQAMVAVGVSRKKFKSMVDTGEILFIPKDEG